MRPVTTTMTALRTVRSSVWRWRRYTEWFSELGYVPLALAASWCLLAIHGTPRTPTVRHGGLPNDSFAGYGVNPVRFDYVLARAGQRPSDPRFRRVDAREGWELYAVCGSKHLPTCGPTHL